MKGKAMACGACGGKGSLRKEGVTIKNIYDSKDLRMCSNCHGSGMEPEVSALTRNEKERLKQFSI